MDTYEGLDILDLIGTNAEDIFSLDSIKTLLEFEEDNNNITYQLPSQLYIGTTMKVNDKWTIGILSHTMMFRNHNRWAVAINASREVLKYFRLGVQYTARSESLFNIGIQGEAKIGPVGGFLIFENIPAFVDPLSTSLFAFRAGLAITL